MTKVTKTIDKYDRNGYIINIVGRAKTLLATSFVRDVAFLFYG
jgi:hypothetical protein